MALGMSQIVIDLGAFDEYEIPFGDDLRASPHVAFSVVSGAPADIVDIKFTALQPTLSITRRNANSCCHTPNHGAIRSQISWRTRS